MGLQPVRDVSISFGMPTFCRQGSGKASAVSSCSIFGE
jgi:hypothetical protein